MSVSKEELLASIQEKMCNFPVTLADLERPNNEFMMNYFVSFLLELGVDNHAMYSKRDDIHFDCFKDSAPYIQVYCVIKKLYPVPKLLKNFSILSLLDPHPNDVGNVHVVDNFHGFVKHKLSTYLNPHFARLDDCRCRLEEVKALRDAKQSAINDAAAQRSKRDIAIAKAEERCMVLADTLATTQEKVQALQTQPKLLESELEALRKENGTLSKQLKQLEANCDRRLRQEKLLRMMEAYQRERAALEEEQQEKSDLLRRKATTRRGLEKALATEEAAAAAAAEVVRLAALSESTSASLPQKERQLSELLEKDNQLSEKVHKIELKLKEFQTARDIEDACIKAAHSPSDPCRKKLTQLQEENKRINEELGSAKAEIKCKSEAIKFSKDALVKLEKDFKEQYREIEKRTKHVFASFTKYLQKKARGL